MSLFSGMKLFVCHINTLKHVCRVHRRLVSGVGNLNDDEIEPLAFTPKQQEEIIQSLHKCVSNNTTRLHLSYRRLQNLKLLFKENPNLKSVEPLLSINGFGPKVLHSLCDSILREGAVPPPPQQSTDVSSEFADQHSQKLRQISSFVTPSHITQPNVERMVSIQIGVNGISWARLRSSEVAEMEVWDILDLSDSMDKKYDIHSVWSLAVQLRHVIPDGDIYVMENSNWSNVASVKKPMKFHIQQAMLTSAICSVFNQSDLGMKPRVETDNRVYFLHTHLPSRLFRKIVGSERVSALDVVDNMIAGSGEKWHQPVTFAPGAVSRYQQVNGPLRDNMSQGLLLAVSFTELVMLKNPSALRILGKSVGAGNTKKSTSES